MANKKILYIDMDGVIADFEAAIHEINPDLELGNYQNADAVDKICEEHTRIFENLPEIPGGVDAVKRLMRHFDVYFLSTPMWNVPDSWGGKRIWIDNKFGNDAHKRLILTHRKDLNIGNFLVDDRTRNGVDRFTGFHIHIGTTQFPDWESVELFLMANIQKDEVKQPERHALVYPPTKSPEHCLDGPSNGDRIDVPGYGLNFPFGRQPIY